MAISASTCTGTLLLLLIQLNLPTTVIGGCTSTDNGWKSSKDCKSYYWCSWGVVGQFYDCVQSELYDETQSKCINPDEHDFQCPGLNWRYDDVESETKTAHTTTLSGSLVNPGKYYCSESYIGQFYTGSCGETACPSGLDSDCPGNERCYQMTSCDESVVPETPPPTPPTNVDSSSGGGNPNNRFCSEFWHEPSWTGPCGYPCPSGDDLDCPDGQKCFVNFDSCVDQGLEVNGWQGSDMTVMSAGAGGAVVNTDRWCGLNFDDMASKCAVSCPNGTDEECPGSEKCFADAPCGPDPTTAPTVYLAPTISPKPSISAHPTASPTTPPPTTARPTSTPTIDPNPNNSYCKAAWDAECGRPCPRGTPEVCDFGHYCFQHQTDCKAEAEAAAANEATGGTKWCGTSFDDMSNRCHQECPGGTDEECPTGEKCFADSQCGTAGTTADIEAKLEDLKGKLWCGRSYKHLVEECPQQCPDGTDEECGDGMTCFNMSEEETSCTTEGKGIRPRVDPKNLWCGNSWIHMLENCPKPCPEGSDEECGNGMTCFDMSNEELICEYIGYGVKEKDDPEKRFCGDTYEKMHQGCPKRCRSGSNDECPGSMNCYSNTLCKTEGVGVIEIQVSDPSKNYCGSSFDDATRCTKSCEGGTDEECGFGMNCYADVPCTGSTQTQSYVLQKPAPVPAPIVEESTPVIEESTPVEETVPSTSTSTMETSDQVDTASESSSETVVAEPSKESATERPPTKAEEFYDLLEDQIAESESEPVESEPQPSQTAETDYVASTETVQSESSNPPPAPVLPDETPESSLVVENVDFILYGMSELTAVHVLAFESLTADYLEEFYNTDSSTNNANIDSVANVEAALDVYNVEGPSRRNLRSRRNLVSEGYRMSFSQLIRYDADLTISLEQVIQYPWSTWQRRNDYVEYMKRTEPRLFSHLSAVSEIILSDDTFVEDGTLLEFHQEKSGSKFQGFKCHNTGVDCPSGECSGGDICMYFSPESTPVQEPAHDASTILDSVIATEVQDGSVSSDTSTRHGLTDVYGEIVIHGTNLVVAEHLREWETFTSVYVQNFYNNEDTSQDYVQKHVNNVLAKMQMQSVTFSEAETSTNSENEMSQMSAAASNSLRSTRIKFKMAISWDTVDDYISYVAIVSQPFFTRDYRDSYIEHMKSYLPGAFFYVTDVSGVNVKSESDVTEPEFELSNTFFCGEKWPIDCNSATTCSNDGDCPSSSQRCFVSSGCLGDEPEHMKDEDLEHTETYESNIFTPPVSTESTNNVPCSFCRVDQVISSYSEVIFNSKSIHCADALEFISDFEEGSSICESAKHALAQDCCVDMNATTNTNQPPTILDNNKPPPVVINTIGTGSGSSSETDTASIMNDKWSTNQEASEPSADEKKENDEFDEDAWFGSWDNFKMKSSSCTLSTSVALATAISLIVLELLFA